jgi:hypothetical protein
VNGQRSAVIEWRAAILASRLKPSARLVALVLSTHMDSDGGSCFPSLTTLAREAGLSRRGVCYALCELEQARLVERARGDRGRATRYHAASAHGALVQTLHHVVQTVHPRDARLAPEDVQEDDQDDFHESSSNRERTHQGENALGQLLAPIERADGYPLDGRGLTDVASAFAESPDGLAALVKRYAERRRQNRVKSGCGALVRAVRRGEHLHAVEFAATHRTLAAARCPDCDVGGGLHAEGCPRARPAVSDTAAAKKSTQGLAT